MKIIKKSRGCLQAYKATWFPCPKVKFKRLSLLRFIINRFLLGSVWSIFSFADFDNHPSCILLLLVAAAFFRISPILLFLLIWGLSAITLLTPLLEAVSFTGYSLFILNLSMLRDLRWFMGEMMCSLSLGSALTAGLGIFKNLMISWEGDLMIIFLVEFLCWVGVLDLIIFDF